MAQGAPPASSHSTISSPSSRNGLGPALSIATGITGYQNRRRTGCWVTSIARNSLTSAPKSAIFLPRHPRGMACRLLYLPQNEAVIALRRFWQAMTTEDFAALDAARVIPILPLAPIQQHRPHLPVQGAAPPSQGS